jgi:isopentenyl-diphosphate delta-isomerase
VSERTILVQNGDTMNWGAAIEHQGWRDESVSDDQELLELVDADGRTTDYGSKELCHRGLGQLHRAFSIYLFSPRMELVLQQRGPEKRLWPLVWSNSCCSHPRRGENEAEACRRRLLEELGVDVPLVRLFSYRYHERYRDLGAEHELCSVFAGRVDARTLRPNRREIEELRLVPAKDLDDALRESPASFTPWLRIAWQRIRTEHWPELSA